MSSKDASILCKDESALHDPEYLIPGVIMALFRWTPHPVIVTIRNNRDYIRVLLYSCCTAITGWGVPLSYHVNLMETQLRKQKAHPARSVT